MAEYQSGAENIGWAQVLPEYNQQLLGRADMYMRLNEQHRREKELQAQRRKAQNDALAKYVGDVFDNKDYATGTAYDPIIQTQLSERIAKYAKMIKDNPETQLSDILPNLSRDANEIAGMSGKLKQLKGTIDEGIKGLKQIKGINAEAIGKLALNDALYDVDEKGNKALKSIDKIDPSQAVIANTLKKYPEFALEDDNAWMEDLGKPSSQATQMVVNKGGVKNLAKYGADMYPFQNWEMKDGHVLLDDKTGLPSLQTKTRNIGGIDLVDEGVYQNLIGNLKTNLAVNKQLKALGIEDGSKAAELAKREILTGMLKSLPSNVRLENLTEDESAKWKEQNATDRMYLKAILKGQNEKTGTDIQDIKGEIMGINNGLISFEKGDRKEILGVPLTRLSSNAQSVILKTGRDILGNNALDQSDFSVRYTPDGDIELLKVIRKPQNEGSSTGANDPIDDFTVIGKLGDVNIKAAKGSKERQEAMSREKQGKKPLTTRIKEGAKKLLNW